MNGCANEKYYVFYSQTSGYITVQQYNQIVISEELQRIFSIQHRWYNFQVTT